MIEMAPAEDDVAQTTQTTLGCEKPHAVHLSLPNAPVKWTQASLAKGSQAQENPRRKTTLARLGPLQRAVGLAFCY
jgi:hypothetical protein